MQVVCPVAWRQRWRTPREFLWPPSDASRGLWVHYPTFFPLSRVAPELNAKFMYQTTRRTVRLIRQKFPFDAILAVWAYPDAVAAMHFSRAYRCPLVINLLGSDANELSQRPALKPLITEAFLHSSSVVVLSRAMGQRVEALGIPGERIVVQYNGVDQVRFNVGDQKTARSRLTLPLGRPIVLYVGNLEPVKGPDILLEAFARLVAQSPEPPLLVMVGGGSLEPALAEGVRRRGLTPHVRLAGKRTHDEVPDWLKAADVLCLPSRMEGCPNVVIEAFASGRPVVATAVGGVPELLEDKRGILVPAEDPDALSLGLAEALDRTWDANAIRQSVEHLTWDAFGRTFERVLRRAVHGAETE
ncbi:glycosyltransferase [Myxococcota bacterium]